MESLRKCDPLKGLLPKTMDDLFAAALPSLEGSNSLHKELVLKEDVGRDIMGILPLY